VTGLERDLAGQVDAVFLESDRCIKIITDQQGNEIMVSCSQTNPHRQNASFGPYSMCWGCEKATP